MEEISGGLNGDVATTTGNDSDHNPFKKVVYIILHMFNVMLN